MAWHHIGSISNHCCYWLFWRLGVDAKRRRGWARRSLPTSDDGASRSPLRQQLFSALCHGYSVVRDATAAKLWCPCMYPFHQHLFLALLCSYPSFLSSFFFSCDWILRNVPFVFQSLAPPTYWFLFLCAVLIRLTIRLNIVRKNRAERAIEIRNIYIYIFKLMHYKMCKLMVKVPCSLKEEWKL